MNAEQLMQRSQGYTDGYLTEMQGLWKHYEKLAAEEAGPGFLERGARAAQEGFGQLAEGKLNVFNPESQIRKTFADQMLQHSVEQAGRVGAEGGAQGLKWFQKIRPGANAVWDTIAHSGMGKGLAAAAGTTAAGAAGLAGLYGIGKSIFGGNQHPQYYGY